MEKAGCADEVQVWQDGKVWYLVRRQAVAVDQEVTSEFREVG